MATEVRSGLSGSTVLAFVAVPLSDLRGIAAPLASNQALVNCSASPAPGLLDEVLAAR